MTRFLKPIAYLCSSIFICSFYLTPVTTNDIWIQIKLGQIIRDTWSIPNTILFSFTESKDFTFIAHEWLSSVVMSIAYDLFNYNGLIVLKFMLSCLLFYLIYILCKRSSQNTYLSLLVSCFTLLTVNYRSFMRPEMFSYVFLLLELNLIHLFLIKKRNNYLYSILFLQIIWSNSHGSFLLGISLPFIFASGLLIDSIRNKLSQKKQIVSTTPLFWKLTFTGLGCLLFTMLNPFGFNLIKHSYNLSQNDYIKSIIFEWNSIFHPAVIASSIYTVFLIYSIVFFPILLFRFKKTTSANLILIIMFSYMTYQAQRHLAYLGLISAWPLATMLKDILKTKLTKKIIYIFLIASTLSASYYSSRYGNTIQIKPGLYKLTRISDHTVNFIRKHNISGNVINSYVLGGQLIFNFYPKVKIIIDSRVDAYGEKYMNFFTSLLSSPYPKLKEFIHKNNINYIILTMRKSYYFLQSKNYYNLSQEGWNPVYKKNNVLILKNNSPYNKISYKGIN